MLCRQGEKQYLWQTLGKEAVFGGDENAIRLSSAEESAVVVPPRETRSEVAEPVFAEPEVSEGEEVASNGHTGNGSADVNGSTGNGTAAVKEASGIEAVIAEAEALKEVLRDAYTRTHQLLANARKYRKQARAVSSTLASLRQLQQLQAIDA